jgi:POT family proton-dependent oligopeptide transporter
MRAQPTTAGRSAAATHHGHPKGLYLLFFTEMWERFSYYGMRALLVLYLTDVTRGGYGWSRAEALSLYGWYTGLVYLTPIIGGWVADRYLGQRRTLVMGGLLMMCGHFSLALPGTTAFYAGLALLIAGNGLFKPNISTMVGGLYAPGDPRRDGAFTIFYMGINIGAALGPMICGYLGERVAWHLGFGAAGVGMLLGVIVFASLNKRMLGIVGLAPKQRAELSPAQKAELARPLNRQDWDRIIVIVVLLFFVTFFWTAFEQAGGLMNLFTDTDVDRVILGWEVPTTWYQMLNAILIVLLGPLFSALWRRLGERGKDPNPAAKMAFGLIFAALGFGVLVIAARQAEGPAKAASVLIVLTYLLHTIGELCLSPVGLSMVTKLAPLRFMSMMMGAWFLANFLGNKLAGTIGASADRYGPEAVFSGIGMATAAAGVVLFAINRALYRMMHGAADNRAGAEAETDAAEQVRATAKPVRAS